jgi:hypothetical protein
MSNYPSYIVLATDPKDETDIAFKDGYYQKCEWSIFTGANALNQADFFAKRLREYFKEVQVRTVGELKDTYKVGA